uniref:Methyl-accepting transducer domain-containing protein n=1 Tax=Ralstonia solanacearum TaxID=305 RepID=A0A0S4WP64_RALSL|nr:protein of unknown function [Ralstonia solanacearum]
MQAVTLAVEKVTAIIHEITQASEEQTSGIEQISHAMGQMDQVTQHLSLIHISEPTRLGMISYAVFCLKKKKKKKKKKKT